MNTPDAGSRPPSAFLPGLASLLLPGLGQVLTKAYWRGASVFLVVATSVATTVWYGRPQWFLVPAALWAWNVWDALRLPRGAPALLPLILWLAMAYGIGWQVTEISIKTLLENTKRAESILRPMTRPDFVARRTEKQEGWVEVQVPCSTQPPRAQNAVGEIELAVTPDCGGVNETLLLSVLGLWPSYPTDITWSTPIGDVKLVGEGGNEMLTVQSDQSGALTAVFQIPQTALAAAPDPTLSLAHRVYVTQRREVEGLTLSTNGRYILQGIYETLGLALLATTVGAIFALPLGFLAAHNLMAGNPVTRLVYFTTRTILNITRSIEALIFAIIFVTVVGLGPFPGMLALTLHTIAALGKLYSEIIEAIDPGPIEAVRATGATWTQVVRYAIIPQIIPPFTALTIYRWDINVRSSTIIGLVGGGGIGFFLYQWILIGDFRAVSASFIAIALVVIALDFFSAQLRERMV
ncbi:MAG TPA: phosphonate ABC transporter, permease protein PhnE [Thermoleophilia bacterium]|nr:phosphonate ABC transporter, permease protein PhnE [Thermoleophilia bacterium]